MSDGLQAKKPLRTVATFLDYSKAYDWMWRANVILTMDEFDVPMQLLRWISALLQNRPARLCLNGTLSRRRRMQ